MAVVCYVWNVGWGGAVGGVARVFVSVLLRWSVSVLPEVDSSWLLCCEEDYNMWLGWLVGFVSVGPLLPLN